MSKFIRVTDASTGVITLQNTATVDFFSDQVMILLDGSNLEIKESAEQIEAQLLRDEFAMAALTGLLASGEKVRAEDVGMYSRHAVGLSYKAGAYADAMLKERSK